MEQAGEYRIAAGKQLVWQSLNDPEVLARCISGCQSMSKVDANSYVASVKAKIGPVSATFAADLELSDIDAPHGYVINASVKGGAAGFGKGSAEVALTEEDAHTVLRYTASANVGGKLAQIGSRLIDSAARKMADDFIAAFKAELEADAHGSVDPSATTGVGAPAARTAVANGAEPKTGGRDQWKVWLVVFAILTVTVILVI